MSHTLLVIAIIFNSAIVSGQNVLLGSMMDKILIVGLIKPTLMLVIVPVPIAVVMILSLMLKIGEEYNSAKHTLTGSSEEDLLSVSVSHLVSYSL